MWWKIYFWFNLIIYVPSMLILLTDWQKFSIGDVILNILAVFTLIALSAFAYKKNLVKQKYWRILFATSILQSILIVLYTYTSFNFLSAIFEAKYMQYLESLYAEKPLYKGMTDIFCVLMSIPSWYVLYALSFKSIQPPKKVKKKIEISKKAHTSKLAIASLVTGILGFILGPGFTVAAFVTGVMGITKIERAQGKLKGIKLAWTGVILSTIQVVILIFLGFIIILFISLPGIFNGYKEAIKHMNKDQLAFYHTKLEKITKDTSEKELNSLLGKPSEVIINNQEITYSYKCPETLAPECVINVYTENNKVKSVGWVNMQGFWYWRDYNVEQ